MASWLEKKKVGLSLNISAGKELVCRNHYASDFLKKTLAILTLSL